MINTYIHVYSAASGFYDWDKQFRQQATWLCAGCNSIKAHVAPIDVIIDRDDGDVEKPLNAMAGGHPGLIWKELLDKFEPQILARDLLIGQVADAEGRQVPGWSTFLGRHELIIRGTKDAKYRVCDQCGRILYHATGKRYLYPEPSGSVDLFESNLAGLVMRESLFNTLDLSKWKKNIYVDKLSIPSSPRDGLGVLGV